MDAIFTYSYLAFCYSFMIALDDGKKWKWYDYLILLVAPIIAPVLLGLMASKGILKEKGK